MTDVTWSKDNSTIPLLNNVPYYSHSQIVIDKVSATYENRLTMIDKSSAAAGTYRCTLSNSRGTILSTALLVEGIYIIYIYITNNCEY